ncbi:glycoside hydrolase domain-containing protein [Microbacterium plantarum]
MTQQYFMSQFGVLSASTTANRPNVIRILQGALWCKGYLGGWTDGVFDRAVAASIGIINGDLGLDPTITSVDLKLLKSLLTMDAYVRVNGGTNEKREVQQWLNGKYSRRRDFPLLPCDGLFSRNAQLGLMYAIQYELDMEDGVANGNFGPGTRRGLRSEATVAPGSKDARHNWVRLYQAALRFNDCNCAFSGTYEESTRTETVAFQSYAELPATGRGDYQTWASLLVSTGDDSRPGIASDMSTQLTSAHCSLLHSKGYRTVGRYLSVLTKRYAPGELGRIFAAGLKTFPIMQEANTSAGDFSYEKGLDHGFQALRRLRQLGFKDGVTAFFAVDFDAIDDEISARVLPYFRGVGSYLNSTSVRYNTGVYGTRNVCSRVISAGLASEGFIASMSWGWSGNLGFKLPPNWSYDQILNYEIRDSATSLEIDKNIQSSRARPAGPSDVSPTPLVLKLPLTEKQFDEDYYWYLVELDVRAEHLEGRANVFARDYVLRYLQRLEPNYREAVWDLYAPAAEEDPLLSLNALTIAEKQDRRVAFEASAPPPLNFLVPRLSHLAASSRGYARFGLIEPGAERTASTGDLAAWAGDLVNAWNEWYLFYRHQSPSLRDWLRSHIGENYADARFSGEDFECDVDAFLAYSLDSENRRSFSDCVRQIEYESMQDPKWRYREFAARRFGGSHEAAAEAGKAIFTGWPWVSVALSRFLEDGVPAPSDAQSSALGLGFADALFAKF